MLLKIYIILGKEIAVLLNEEKQPGVYEADFNGINLTSGIYFDRLDTGMYHNTKKLLLLK